MRREVETFAGHINGTFSEFDWAPVRYLNRGFKRQTLMGFLRLSDVGLVTPLRDGMNLVAKEFAACQVDDPGVLVLSRFAGAAHEMPEALLVNPYDVDATARVLARAHRPPRRSRPASLAGRGAGPRLRAGGRGPGRWPHGRDRRRRPAAGGRGPRPPRPHLP